MVERHRNGSQYVFLSGSYGPATAAMLYGDLAEDLTAADRSGNFRGEMSVALLCEHDPSVWLRYSDGEWMKSLVSRAQTPPPSLRRHLGLNSSATSSPPR